jgi:uncharacterized protein YuzE
MEICYDREVDALAIEVVVNGRSAQTEEVFEGINLDFNAKGKLVAIEILDASRFGEEERPPAVPPSPATNFTLAGRRRRASCQLVHLRSLFRNRLRGKKVGRDWKVELADLYNYLERERTPGKR